MCVREICRALVLASFLVTAFAVQTGAGADTAKVRRTITLSGTGEISGQPDKVVISIGVVREAKTPGEALRRNTDAMRRIMAKLQSSGIAEKDLQTTNFSVQPRHYYDPKNRRAPPRIVGYTVSNQLSIVVREIAKLGALLDQVVSLSSNKINSIRFALTDPQPLRDEARRIATRDAIRKAKLYAEAAGIKLGPIIRITEGRVSAPQPVYARAEALAASSRAVPIAPGQQSLTVQVNIVWLIE